MPYIPANALPVQKRSLGVAKEVTTGTYVVPANYAPIKDFNPVPVVDPLMVEALLGSMVTEYGYLQGIESSTFDITGDVYVDSWGYFLAAFMGVDDTTGASAPFTHKLSVKNSGTGQPTSQSLTDSFAATNAQAYTACIYSSVELNFAPDKILEGTIKGIGLLPTTETNGVPTYSAVLPMPNWAFTMSIAGVATTLYSTALTVTLDRKNEVIKGLTGTQYPAELFAGYMSAMWKGTFVTDPANTVILSYYLGNTEPSLSLTATRGTGAALETLTVTSSQVAFTTASLKQTGPYLSVDFEGTGIANATDVGTQGGLGVATLVLGNAFPAGVYV